MLSAFLKSNFLSIIICIVILRSLIATILLTYIFILSYLYFNSCQFVVKEDGDYKANLLDPDIPMKWDQLEEIVSNY